MCRVDSAIALRSSVFLINRDCCVMRNRRYMRLDFVYNWRLNFEFRDGNAYVLDYEDYH